MIRRRARPEEPARVPVWALFGGRLEIGISARRRPAPSPRARRRLAPCPRPTDALALPHPRLPPPRPRASSNLSALSLGLWSSRTSLPRSTSRPSFRPSGPWLPLSRLPPAPAPTYDSRFGRAPPPARSPSSSHALNHHRPLVSLCPSPVARSPLGPETDRLSVRCPCLTRQPDRKTSQEAFPARSPVRLLARRVPNPADLPINSTHPSLSSRPSLPTRRVPV